LKECTDCKSVHYLSYVIDSKSNKKIFFKDALTFPYFHYTNETILETIMLESVLADFMYKHCGFRAFTDAYNSLYAVNCDNRFKLNRLRLADIFYCYELVKFYKEHNIAEPLIGNILKINVNRYYSNCISI
jgi:hypothetical protein